MSGSSDAFGSEHDSAEVPIAIVGLGALFPRSGDLSEFWNNILGGVDCIQEVPETHWNPDDYYDPDPTAEDKTYSTRGGFIPAVPFDPMEYGIPPSTLDVTGVLQLLSLVVAKQTLGDANWWGAEWANSSRAGVILGVGGGNSMIQPMVSRMQTPILKEVVRSCGLSERDADEIAAKFVKAYAPWKANTFPGMLGNVVAGRIANRFDFGGLNCTVDAACASSLAAIRMAASELVSGRADFMLTGGCDTESSIVMYMCFSKTPALTPSGVIRPFDESADGTLLGEGIGMLGMKRLADAQRDGDRIYAVLRGIGSSSDGRFKSIYAPSHDGQVTALRRAHSQAGFGPEQVGLLECHGTGTVVGDITEVGALKEVYSEYTDTPRSVALGSVKSQIGHTKCAAGAAGMIKMALALHHKVLPPTINVDQPRVHMGFEGSPFYPNVRTLPWIRDPGKPVRRAGVSSFGFGGTNFHCLLEEADPELQRVGHDTNVVHLWHAGTPELLIEELAQRPESSDSHDPVPPEHVRLALVSRSEDELADLRQRALEYLRSQPEVEEFTFNEGVYYRRSGQLPGKVAALFAGQGSQYVGMGASAAVALPPVRAAIDDAAQHSPGDEPLGRVLYPAPAHDAQSKARQEADLRRTDNAQPALGAIEVGQYEYLSSLGFAPEGALGHSFGELTALWAAGSLTTDEFHRLARARGTAMARCSGESDDPGTMAAVPAAAERVEQVLAEHPEVRVCNLNAPEQVAVGGPTDAVEDFVRDCVARGIRADLLPVAAAFHTPLVQDAVPPFQHAVSEVAVREPNIPVYANTSGREYGSDSATNGAVLVEQIINPVDFAARVQQMYADGFRVFVEFGPKNVLSGLVNRSVGADAVVLAADSAPAADDDRTVKQLAARLAVLGAPLCGLNRWAAPEEEHPEPSGRMLIHLDSQDYVPENRRLAYENALASGYRIEGAVEKNNDPVQDRDEPQSVPVLGAEADSYSRTSGSGSVVWDLAAEHLSMHRAYLSNQFSVAEQMSTIMRQEAENGVRRDVVDGLNAVTQHSVAMGHSHMHASDVLRGFAEMESDGVSTAPTYEVPSTPRLPGPPGTPRPGPNEHSGGVSHNGAPQPASAAAAAEPSSAAAAQPASAAAAQPASAPAAAPAEGTGPGSGPPESASGNGSASQPMTTEAIRAALLDIVADKTGYPTDMLELEMNIESDLGIDSIKRVEILSALQENFPDAPTAEPEQLFQLATLSEVVDFLAALTESSDVPVVSDGPKAEGGGGLVRCQARLSSLPAPDEQVEAFRDGGVALLVGAWSPMLVMVAERLRNEGWTVHTDPPEGECDDALDLVLHVLPESTELEASLEELRASVLLAGSVQHSLERGDAAGRAAFVVVTRVDGRMGLGRAQLPSALLGGVSGLVKTLALESPSIFARAVDLAPDIDDAEAARALSLELNDPNHAVTEVGLDADGSRRTLTLSEAAPVPESGPVSGRDDVFLVTGGGRGITAACATGLARCFGSGVVLLGRTPLEDEPEWSLGVAEPDLRAAAAEFLRNGDVKPVPREVDRLSRRVLASREVREVLRAVRDAGAMAEYLSVDIADPEAVRAAIAPYRDRISGVVHGAGAIADRPLHRKQPEDVTRVFEPKLNGLFTVFDALPVENLRHVLLFSSVAGLFGNPGQSDYAVANETLNRIASWFGRNHPEVNAQALNWGAWSGGMVRPELRRFFAERGVELIPMETGVQAFVQELTAPDARSPVRVLSPRTQLGARPRTAPRGTTVVRRDLSDVAEDPVVLDHRIAGVPVLPATAALGAVLNVVNQVYSSRARVVREFAVFKGVVFEGQCAESLAFELSTSGQDEVAVRVRDESGRPRYRAHVELDGALDAGQTVVLPGEPHAEDVDVYGDGTLFHGPALRGVHQIVSYDAEGILVSCQLDTASIAGGSYAIAEYDPVLTDLLLQAGAVWVRRYYGMACLPSAIGRLELHRALPSGRRFHVAVRNIRTSGSTLSSDIFAVDGEGQPYVVIRDVESVASAGLNTAFSGGTRS